MELTYVDTLPERRRKKHNLQCMIDEFAKSPKEIAKIDLKDDEYKSIVDAYNSIRRACGGSKHPVCCVRIDGELFLVKEWVLD